MNPIIVEAEVVVNDLRVPASVEGNDLRTEADLAVEIQPFIPYTGEYEFTPSSETQTIPIYNKIASADIVINPIPSNYGLISWNGSTLTVS